MAKHDHFLVAARASWTWEVPGGDVSHAIESVNQAAMLAIKFQRHRRKNIILFGAAAIVVW